MAGWTNLKTLLYEEITQRGEEGCNIAGFYERHAECGSDPSKLLALYGELCALAVADDFPFYEPNTLDEIKALSDGFLHHPTADVTEDQFLGAWLGRCIGCALGKPLETGFSMNGSGGRPGWRNVKLWFEEAGAYPIETYTPQESNAQNKYGISIGCPASTREHIRFMETDDDIRYTVLGLILLEQKGGSFWSWDVGELWLRYLPYHMVCTAEKQAYLNYANAEIENEAERLRYVREYLNPYREWIGAQIRVDAYAYAAAGNPIRAAELAFADASFSHVKNGIYGAMFISAMIAAAFTEGDHTAHGIRRCIQTGLSVIPKTSRLYADIKRAVALAEEAQTQEALVSSIWDAFCHYHPVHTNNNAALCAAALLWSDGDFERAITTAVLGGWDTDCNGATVGSFMGAMLGAESIPAKWRDPLHNTLYSAIPDFHPISISECARRSFETFRRLKNS